MPYLRIHDYEVGEDATQLFTVGDDFVRSATTLGNLDLCLSLSKLIRI